MRTEIVVLLALAGIALASMLVFRAVFRPERSVAASRGSFVLGSWVREWFYWFLRPLERVILAAGLSPEVFNVLGVLFGLAAMVALFDGRLALAGGAVLLGGLADVLDGVVARARGLVSPRGAFLDSTLDRFAEVAAFVGLAVLFRGSEVALVLVVTALGGSLLVSYARARGESVGVVCKLGIMQRAERLLALGLGGILDPAVSAAFGRPEGALLAPVVGLVAAGTVGTAIFRTVWIARRLG